MTIMCNRVGIWVSRQRNTEFRPIFVGNYRFRLNQRLTTLDFKQKFEIFKPVNMYIRDHNM
jgi:hypothetical protein